VDQQRSTALQHLAISNATFHDARVCYDNKRLAGHHSPDTFLPSGADRRFSGIGRRWQRRCPSRHGWLASMITRTLALYLLFVGFSEGSLEDSFSASNTSMTPSARPMDAGTLAASMRHLLQGCTFGGEQCHERLSLCRECSHDRCEWASHSPHLCQYQLSAAGSVLSSPWLRLYQGNIVLGSGTRVASWGDCNFAVSQAGSSYQPEQVQATSIGTVVRFDGSRRMQQGDLTSNPLTLASTGVSIFMLLSASSFSGTVTPIEMWFNGNKRLYFYGAISASMLHELLLQRLHQRR
jgi:hypothetical protein